jgi:hypothetical protein
MVDQQGGIGVIRRGTKIHPTSYPILGSGFANCTAIAVPNEAARVVFGVKSPGCGQLLEIVEA